MCTFLNTYEDLNVLTIKKEKEIIDIIKYANKNKERVKVVGSGHSPNNMYVIYLNL